MVFISAGDELAAMVMIRGSDRIVTSCGAFGALVSVGKTRVDEDQAPA